MPTLHNKSLRRRIQALRMLTTSILRMAQGGERTMFVEQGVYRSRQFSYAEVTERALAFSDWLKDRGLAAQPSREAPRVILWARPGARWAMAFYGCVLAGAVVAPVDAGFSADFVRNVAERISASLLISDATTEKTLASAEIPRAVPRFSMEKIENLPRRGARPDVAPAAGRDNLLEIVYTSGTTAQPRGVMITHGNLLANLEPIEKEIRRYQALSLPFRPLRFLHLIPLSHLFGQVMGLFIPQLLQAEVIFPESQSPAQLARIMRERRASVMVSVPQQLEALAAWALEQLKTRTGEPPQGQIERSLRERWPVRKRWWRFRRVHRALGWKMWAFVVGGARLPAAVETLWNALGYAVIQGYGLTETAPAISITHPFKIQRGAVGRPLAGVETRIAADGEILVRGANVSPGYFGDPEATRAVFSDGWLHTGDLGKFDEEGNLIYLGRKKEMMVTAEGLNVFPEDVEGALLKQPAILEAAAVGKESRTKPPGPGEPPGGRTVVHAVIVPAGEPTDEEIEAAIEQANRLLEPHQRVRGFSLWPGSSLPRTLTTGKVQRAAIAAWVNSSPTGTPGAPARSPEEPAGWRQFLIGLGVSPGRLRSEARLAEDLGLSSLDRVELMTWMESQGYSVSEEWIAQAVTVGDIEKAARAGTPSLRGGAVEDLSAEASAVAPVRPLDEPPRNDLHQEPKWTISLPAIALRDLLQRTLVFPLMRYYVEAEFAGLERLRNINAPVLFVANHQSFFDAALIERALPWRLRRRLAPAMSGEVFRAHSRFSLFLTRLIFNGYLISQNPARAQEALRRAGWLAEHGYSTLIFPEGERTSDGKLQPFRPGAGVMAERVGLPVVALRIEGLYEIWPRSSRYPRRGRASVTVGETFRLEPGETAATFTKRLENYYRTWNS
jgi:long-chain acyl-CoA synthetase